MELLDGVCTRQHPSALAHSLSRAPRSDLLLHRQKVARWRSSNRRGRFDRMALEQFPAPAAIRCQNRAYVSPHGRAVCSCVRLAARARATRPGLGAVACTLTSSLHRRLAGSMPVRRACVLCLLGFRLGSNAILGRPRSDQPTSLGDTERAMSEESTTPDLVEGAQGGRGAGDSHRTSSEVRSPMRGGRACSASSSNRSWQTSGCPGAVSSSIARLWA